MTLPRLRRLSQIFFLALLVVLLCATGDRAARALRLFFDIDPFAAAVNAIGTRALYRGLVWSLVILVPTFFLGRFFCGWICPLGTLNHFAVTYQKRGRQRVTTNRYKRWQGFKYYLLIALLAAAFFGGALAGVIDPISLAVRSIGLSGVPAIDYALNGNLIFPQPHFRQGFLFALLLLTILLLNLRVTRLWCRAVCPLGALLGLASRWSILGLEKRAEQCGDCNRCLLHCQGGDDPIPGAPWRKAECHLCMNCVADCPDGALRFRLFPRDTATVESPDLNRRRALVGLGAGAAAIPLLRANTGLAAEPHERLIRPPAALDEHAFLARCIRCGECMKACPKNALQPALTEAGWEGFWTPVLVPRIGYCEPSCTLCGQVCPTGAIWQFTAKEKAWVGAPPDAKPIRIGTAFYDRGRCLPWAMATECIVCEEWCPTSPKAIYLRPAEVIDRAANTQQVRQPYLDPDRCVGCGACEYACPVRDRPAIYVTSVGESRSATNQMVLPRHAKPASWLPETGEAPGWTKTDATRVFEAADLWKYIDGDAERFLRAGVRRTFTAGYRYKDATEAVADVHVFDAAEGARAIFEAEPAAGSRAMAIGDAGRTYGQSVTFRQGPCFVRVTAYRDAPGIEAALIALAQAIASWVKLAINESE